jgi:hypothetical protein
MTVIVECYKRNGCCLIVMASNVTPFPAMKQK